MDETVIGWLATAILVPALGFLANEFWKRRQEWRALRVARLEAEIRDLYAPLYSDLLASEAIWSGFRGVFWPAHGGQGYDPDSDRTTDDEREAWRRAVVDTFMPINERIEARLLAQAHLIGLSGMPAPFQAFLVHVAGYRVLIGAWSRGDFRRHASLNNFPVEMIDLVRDRLNDRSEKLRLLQERSFF